MFHNSCSIYFIFGNQTLLRNSCPQSHLVELLEVLLRDDVVGVEVEHVEEEVPERRREGGSGKEGPLNIEQLDRMLSPVSQKN